MQSNLVLNSGIENFPKAENIGAVRDRHENMKMQISRKP